MSTRLLILIVAAGLTGASTANAAEYFSQQFGTDSLNTRLLGYNSPLAAEAMVETSGGLLITLPGELPGHTRAGVVTRFLVEGDFEVTIGYQLMEVKQPDKGYGAGVMLRLPKSEGSEVTFARRKLPNGNNIFRTNLITPGGGTMQHDQEAYDALADHGQLRLTRTGSTLRYLVADGEEEEFRELRQVEFAGGPIRSVNLLACTGESQELLSVRLTHLSIRADRLPFGLPEGRKRFVRSTWVILGSAGIVFLVGCGVWYWRTARQA